MTSISSSNQKISPEYLFKGKGIRLKVNPPSGSTVRWAEKGYYREENVLPFIKKNARANQSHFSLQEDVYTYYRQVPPRENLINVAVKLF